MLLMAALPVSPADGCQLAPKLTGATCLGERIGRSAGLAANACPGSCLSDGRGRAQARGFGSSIGCGASCKGNKGREGCGKASGIRRMRRQRMAPHPGHNTPAAPLCGSSRLTECVAALKERPHVPIACRERGATGQETLVGTTALAGSYRKACACGGPSDTFGG